MDVILARGYFPYLVIIKPEPVDKVLIEATVRKIRVDAIKVKVWRTGISEEYTGISATTFPFFPKTPQFFSPTGYNGHRTRTANTAAVSSDDS